MFDITLKWPTGVCGGALNFTALWYTCLPLWTAGIRQYHAQVIYRCVHACMHDLMHGLNANVMRVMQMHYRHWGFGDHLRRVHALHFLRSPFPWRHPRFLLACFPLNMKPAVCLVLVVFLCVFMFTHTWWLIPASTALLSDIIHNVVTTRAR